MGCRCDVKHALQMSARRRKCAMQLVRAQEHVSLQKELVLLVTRVHPHQVCTGLIDFEHHACLHVPGALL